MVENSVDKKLIPLLGNQERKIESSGLRSLSTEEVIFQKLVKKETQLGHLLSHSKDAVIICDKSRRIVELNPCAADLVGGTVDFVKSLSIDEIIPVDQLVGIQRKLELKEEGESTHIECKVKKLDGTKIEVEINACLVDTEKFIMQIVLRDLTERRKFENALRESEQLFRSAFSDSVVGIVLTDPQGRFVRFNKAFAEMLGYEEEELLNKDVFSVTHPQDARGSKEGIHKISHGATKSFQIEKRYLHKSGKTVWGQVTVSALKNESGKTTNLIAHVLDISDKKKDEYVFQKILSANILLQKTAEAANLAPNPNVGSQTVMALICNHSEWEIGHMYMPNAKERLVLVPTNNWFFKDMDPLEELQEETQSLDFFPGFGLPGKVYQSRKPMWIEDVLEKEWFVRSRICSKWGVKSTFAFPVFIKDEVVSVLELFSRSRVMVDSAFVKIMNQVGVQLGRVFERTRMEKEILEISGREQRRIGQDLHDELGQQLTGIAFMTRVLQNKLTAKGYDEAEDTQRLIKIIEAAIGSTQSLARGLNPVALESNGLIGALHDLAKNTEFQFGANCIVNIRGKVEVKDSEAAVNLYRIAQEAVTNSVKHRNAETIEIRLLEKEGKISLAITDNGMDENKEKAKGSGMGLRTMRYRAQSIGAKLVICKKPSGGTAVVCTLPADLR